ncbi:MAG: chitobiase/beta-hexosaminidase C-terminal domain-containing protein [Clostridia bacterium]|nr:chitobiase/beta-hexosaminidase C-terminal domain-containing protein [Clostridia bacterium]
MKSTGRKSKKGFTLVELIVSMGLGTLVIGLIFSAFLFGTRTYNLGESQRNLQSELRIASDAIRNEVRYASDLLVVSSFDPSTALDTMNYIYLAADGQTLMLDRIGASAREMMSFAGSGASLGVTFTKDSISGDAVAFSESITGSSPAEDILRYTVTGTSAKDGKTFAVNSEVTLLNNNSMIVNVGFLEGPMANPLDGEVLAGTMVELTAPTGTTIYYTNNGEDPTAANWIPYDPVARIPINTSQRIKAIAVLPDGRSSYVAIYDYTVIVARPSVVSITMTPNSPRVGNTMQIVYTFKHDDISALQGHSTVVWYRDGVTFLTQTYDPDASINTFTYTTTSVDKNKFIHVVVTPHALPSPSNPTDPETVGDPVACEPLKVKP